MTFGLKNFLLRSVSPIQGVNDILEDHRGFLWIATWSGLAKYDGYTLKMYRQQPDNANGLKSNKITRLFEDSKGNLWIGTNYTGFYRYNRDQDIFEQYCRNSADMNSLSNDNVWAIFEDEEGIFWIGTEKGLNRFNPVTGHFIHYENDPTDSRTLSYDFVYSITQTVDGSLWVGTEEGLNRLITNDKEEYFIRYDLIPGGTPNDQLLPHNFIYKIIPSRFEPDILWICTSIGLKKVRFSGDDLSFLDSQFFGHDPLVPSSLSHPFISDVLEENHSRIWISTYNGLNLLDQKSGQIQHFNAQKFNLNSLSNNLLMCLSQDRTGNLWIGMDKGVNKLNLQAKAFRCIRPDAGDNINCSVTCLVSASHRPGMWAGSRGCGLIFLPTENEISFPSMPVNYRFGTSKMPELAGFIFDLLLDKDGWLWVATDGAGVIRVHEKEILNQKDTIWNYQQFTQSKELSDNYVMSLLQVASGDIWMGYWDKGLDRYDPVTGIFHHYLVTSDLSVNFQKYPAVHLIETIEQGQAFLWLGTRGGGIYKLRYNEKNNNLDLIQHFHSESNERGNLSNNSINAFLIDQEGRLWVGTDNGLNLLNKKSGEFTSYFEADGLANDIIQSIQEDEEGNIWVSTQQGISCLSFAEDLIMVKNFDAFDGLQDNFFNDDAAMSQITTNILV